MVRPALLFTTAACATALLGTLGARDAHAGHSADPDVDYLAETLDQWDFRLSLTRVDVGVYENVSVGSYYWLPLIKVPEVHARWTFFQSARWAVATQLGYMSFEPKDFDKGAKSDAKLQIVPFELLATYTIRDDLRASLGFGYTEASVASGQLAQASKDAEEESALDSAEASLGVSTGRLDAAFEWRLSDQFAVSAEAQAMLFQKGGGAATQTIQADPRTQLVLHQQASADLNTGARGNLGFGATWAWEHFHLKLGLYRGALVVPLLGTFVRSPLGLMPELDLSWRF